MKYTNAEKLRYFQKYENNSSPDRQNDRQSAISRVWRTFRGIRVVGKGSWKEREIGKV